MDAAWRADVDPVALDEADPLAGFRAEFDLDAEGLIYLDGNSLGRPPRAAREAIARVVESEWTHALIRGWDDWVDLPHRAGDLLAEAVLGAGPGEVLVSDSTSVNLYKLAAAALDASPADRRVIVTDDDNFPTDRYILDGLAQRRGARVRLLHTDIDAGVDSDAVAAAVGRDTALVCLSHVAYRSGGLADMAEVTRIAHEAGALVLWDLCHSAGVVPVRLEECGVDLAVGCTYKYLNAGPGSPAFLYVRGPLRSQLQQPIWGWFSQRDQFDMGPRYAPVDDIGRFAVGTPAVIATAAVEAAAGVTARAGIDAIRRKSLDLGRYAVALHDEWLAPRGFTLASPREADRRGGHVTVAHPDAWRIGQAMRARGVIPDFRTPDRLRLGFAPLYNGFAEIREAFTRIVDIVDSDAQQGFARERGRVT